MSEENHIECTFPASVKRVTQADKQFAWAARVLDEQPGDLNPYFFSAEISNGRLDSHFTRMDVSSLKNYAEDAESGVVFLYSHDCAEIVGRSMGGQFVGGQGNGVARVLADFYAIPGLQLGSTPSDQIILGIRSGVLSDVSIGFFGGEWICSICGRDIWKDRECWHLPGCKAEVEGNGTVKEEICTADVKRERCATSCKNSLQF